MPVPLTPHWRAGWKYYKCNLGLKTEKNGAGENSNAHNTIRRVWSLHSILHGIALCTMVTLQNGLVHAHGVIRRAQ